MIFVTVGTSTFPFDRLLRQVDTFADGDEDVVVQYGSARFVPRATVASGFMDYDEVADRMRAARVVVAHAGAGSILTALSVGVRPVVVPRRSELGEVVDDHQWELSQRLARAELVTLVDDVADLTVDRLASVSGRHVTGGGSSLVDEVARFVESALARG